MQSSSSPSFTVQRASTQEHLDGIKLLQTANLKRNLPRDEWEREGFTTAEYAIMFDLMRIVE
jgi:hypothetical protein